MQIDWLTAAAQIVNFLVLVWLLRRFLYGPITRAMKRREERIEARLREAKDMRSEAEAEAEELRRRQRELDERREEIMDEARREAESMRKRLEAEAREDVEERGRAWRRQVEDERDAFLADLRTRAARHVNELARAALSDLADAGLEEQAAARFVAELGQLDETRRGKIAEAAREEGGSVRVESAFELPSSARSRLTRAIREQVAEGLEVEYAAGEDLVLGVRLLAGGQTVEWSLSNHLKRFEAAVSEKLDEVRRTGERAAA